MSGKVAADFPSVFRGGGFSTSFVESFRSSYTYGGSPPRSFGQMEGFRGVLLSRVARGGS